MQIPGALPPGLGDTLKNCLCYLIAGRLVLDGVVCYRARSVLRTVAGGLNIGKGQTTASCEAFFYRRGLSRRFGRFRIAARIVFNQDAE